MSYMPYDPGGLVHATDVDDEPSDGTAEAPGRWVEVDESDTGGFAEEVPSPAVDYPFELDDFQLDSLRALLFKPEIYTQWERLVDRAVYPA